MFKDVNPPNLKNGKFLYIIKDKGFLNINESKTTKIVPTNITDCLKNPLAKPKKAPEIKTTNIKISTIFMQQLLIHYYYITIIIKNKYIFFTPSTC